MQDRYGTGLARDSRILLNAGDARPMRTHEWTFLSGDWESSDGIGSRAAMKLTQRLMHEYGVVLYVHTRALQQSQGYFTQYSMEQKWDEAATMLDPTIRAPKYTCVLAAPHRSHLGITFSSVPIKSRSPNHAAHDGSVRVLRPDIPIVVLRRNGRTSCIERPNERTGGTSCSISPASVLDDGRQPPSSHL